MGILFNSVVNTELVKDAVETTHYRFSLFFLRLGGEQYEDDFSSSPIRRERLQIRAGLLPLEHPLLMMRSE